MRREIEGMVQCPACLDILFPPFVVREGRWVPLDPKLHSGPDGIIHLPCCRPVRIIRGPRTLP